MRGLAIAAVLLHATGSTLEETDFMDQIKEELDFADGTVLGLQRGCPSNSDIEQGEQNDLCVKVCLFLIYIYMYKS